MTNCLILIDCTDCPIAEPTPHIFDRTYWSRKINGPALKYEVARCIFTGYICHWNGPHKPSVADITIFREELLHKLDHGEVVETDNGCGGENETKTPDIAKSRVGRKQKSVVRAAQENIFAKVKMFGAFETCWDHSHAKHGWAFGAALVITQLGFEHGTLGQYETRYTNEYF